jgi:hypothetical protein
MEKDTSFSAVLLPALDAKLRWFDAEELPKMLNNYRLLHTCTKNIFELLLKKSLINKDPYKLDKKISDIVCPEDTPFSEGERSLVVGMRFSDYESMLDFLCNYFKFAVSHLPIDTIRKLVSLNNSFQWTSFSVNHQKANTRGLAQLVTNARQGSDSITASMINDSINKAAKAVGSINSTLKELTEFQRELYKGEIRKNIFEYPAFNNVKAAESPADEMQQIRKFFPAVMGKTPFYNDLIEEVVQEDHAPNKDQLRRAVTDKLAVNSSSSEKQTVKVDTKENLMDSLRVLGAMTAQIDVVLEKIQENHDILEGEHNTLKDKLLKLFREAFSIPEKPVVYSVLIVDQVTGTQRREQVNFQQLATDLANRSRRFASVAVKHSPGYAKIAAMPEDKILEYINTQISESMNMLTLLNALDEFFKGAPQPQNRTRIKGLKMEITSLKNCIVKANQRRAEYAAYVEEVAQMKKLGITDETD